MDEIDSFDFFPMNLLDDDDDDHRAVCASDEAGGVFEESLRSLENAAKLKPCIAVMIIQLCNTRY